MGGWLDLSRGLVVFVRFVYLFFEKIRGIPFSLSTFDTKRKGRRTMCISRLRKRKEKKKKDCSSSHMQIQ